MFAGDEGADVGDFPLDELSVDTLRERWGPGYYRVHFTGTRNGKSKALGHREIVVNEPAATVTATPRQAPSSAGGDLAHAFAIVDAIGQRAAVEVERERGFLQMCLAAVVGNRGAEPSAELVALRQELASLRAELAAPTDEDDDDEDDDETTTTPEKPFKVGKNIGDAALVASLNGLAETLGALAPHLQTLVMAKIQQEVEKATAATKNGAAVAAAGATTG